MKEDGSKWPNELDLRLAVEAILNVQNVYNISIHQLRQGTIGMAVVQPLTADDIFFIGSAAKDYGMTYEAITWFEYLAQHLDEFVTRNFSASTLHRRLSSSYFEVSPYTFVTIPTTKIYSPTKNSPYLKIS